MTADRPITRPQGGSGYIASFNLLGQARLNRALGELMHRRLTDEGIAPGSVFDAVVCAKSKAVGMAQVLVEHFRLDRYVVLCEGVKNYMPRRPLAPLVEEAASITTARAQSLVLDPNDRPLVEGRRILLVDDVIANGRHGARRLRPAGPRRRAGGRRHHPPQGPCARLAAPPRPGPPAAATPHWLPDHRNSTA